MTKANKIIFDFILKGKDKVKRFTLASEIEDGGLKSPYLEYIIERQKVPCCKKLENDQPSRWKTILRHYLKPFGRKLVLCCNLNFSITLAPKMIPRTDLFYTRHAEG